MPLLLRAPTTAHCVCHILFLKMFSRGCKQRIQSCTNEDTACALVISIWGAKSTYLQILSDFKQYCVADLFTFPL